MGGLFLSRGRGGSNSCEFGFGEEVGISVSQALQVTVGTPLAFLGVRLWVGEGEGGEFLSELG